MVTPVDMAKLQKLMVGRTGYVLTDDRAYVVESRLGPLARREGLTSVSALIQSLDEAGRPSLVWEAAEAMLSVDSSFCRDREPFNVLSSDLLPALASARPGGRVRILSAGCASGQEAWSIAMCAAEANLQGVEIFAVDLNSRALEKAEQAIYSQFEVQRGLRSHRLVRWFSRDDEMWRVRDELRPLVKFARRNLLDGSTGQGGYDLIFCRYVLSDMTPQARRRTLAGLETDLAAGGCLFLGVSEVLPEISEAFRPIAGLRGAYVRSPTQVSRAA